LNRRFSALPFLSAELMGGVHFTAKKASQRYMTKPTPDIKKTL
jgi:hypothetical protein